MTINSAFPWNGSDHNNVGMEKYAKNPNGSNFPPQPVQTIQDYIRQKETQTVVGTVHGDYNKPGQGIKHDAGKPKFDLIPFDLMDGEQRVWEKGAKKYAPNNWRKGMPITQPLNAAMRHLTAFMTGQDLDPETQESHLDHLICCIRMAQNTMKYYPKLDDRNKWEPPKGE